MQILTNHPRLLLSVMGPCCPVLNGPCLVCYRGSPRSFKLAPENGFGQPNDNNVQVIKRDQFDDDIRLETGMVFNFADAAGGELPGVIAYFDEDEVHVDFNHPLAGRVITFRVQIHGVEAAELH
jgi:FKBP-type peptidyl-prolyl cis-trans isomerases 2